MRRAAKVDANHDEIVNALRQCGARVQRLEQGGGVPDLLVALPEPTPAHWRTLLVEVKDGRKVPSARKLTDDQRRWIANWPGEVQVISSVDEAIELARWKRCAGSGLATTASPPTIGGSPSSASATAAATPSMPIND